MAMARVNNLQHLKAGLHTSRSGSPPLLVLPGFLGSPPEHWQSLWQSEAACSASAAASWHRAEQTSWTEPTLQDWLPRLVSAIEAASAPPVLVCHSLGSVLATHYLAAREQAGFPAVAAAFLVTPGDVDQFEEPLATTLGSFRGLPLVDLGVPTTFIMSTDDPVGACQR